MNCPNPKCGWDDEQYAENFGYEYAKHYPLFQYKVEDGNGRRVLVYRELTVGHFWIRCTMCDTEFRPTKTLNNPRPSEGSPSSSGRTT